MKGKKTNQEIHESKRREEEACLEEKQNIEETASGQDVTESRSEYDRLLLLVKKGNTQAFGEFYEKTRGQVYGYAYRMLQQAPGCGGGGPGNISEDMERGSVL